MSHMYRGYVFSMEYHHLQDNSRSRPVPGNDVQSSADFLVSPSETFIFFCVDQIFLLHNSPPTFFIFCVILGSVILYHIIIEERGRYFESIQYNKCG